MAKERPEDYATFYRSFGPVLKEGLHFEPDRADALLKLLRYESSKEDGLVSLSSYKERMASGQKAIYYALGESRRQVEGSPHLEGLRSRGFEVLYMTDPIDQWAIASLKEFDGVPLVSASDAELSFDDGAGSDEEAGGDETLNVLRERIRARLQDHVDAVRVSRRLTDSPVCLVVPSGGLQPHIERLLRAAQQGLPPAKRIMEINPDHPVIRNMERLLARAAETARVDDWIDLLYAQALVAEGSPLEDPSLFARRLTDLMRDVSDRAVASAG
jgi:molecular chaperone HtpG